MLRSRTVRRGSTVRTLPLRAVILGLGVLAWSSAHVSAQTTTLGAIEGTVRDETGGPLPGVTVTVTSPALQVKALDVVTDGEGRYRVPDLRIGLYRMQYELSGFQGFVRDAVEITVGFVARVDVTMKVGSVQETITVSGASPVVDLTTTRGGQTIATSIVTRAIPLVGHQVDMVKLTPGLEGGLGGRAANPTQLGLTGNVSLSAYGQTGVTAMVEDFQMHSNNQPPMLGGTEQMDVKTFGNTAEIQNPGAALNYVFSSGGNQFHGKLLTLFMHDSIGQANNVDANLRANGFTSSEALRRYHDLQGSLSGRLLRDKLWFFTSLRQRANERSLGGFVLNAGPDGQYLTGDEPPAYPSASQNGQVIKLSNQLTNKYQIGGFWWRDWTRDPGTATSGFFGNASPRVIPWEASTIYNLYDYIWNVSFRGTPSNRSAFEIKGGRASYHTLYEPQPGSEVLPTRYNRNTFLYTGSPLSNGITTTADRFGTTYFHQFVGSLSYVPERLLGGDHQLKVGFRTMLSTAGGAVPKHRAGDYGLVYDTVNGVPNQPVEIFTLSSPLDALNRLNMHSVYASDQWRVSERLTFNLGLRFERQNAFVPPQEQPEGTFVRAASYPKIPVGAWNLWAPRMAAAWDVTGRAKTVLKATYGWYNQELEYQATQFASLYNPVAATTTQYRWRDLNRNNDYDSGEVDLSLNGPDFINITSAANTRPLSPDFNVPHTHEITAALEHEIIPSMAGRFLYVYKRLVDTYIVGTPINTARPYSAFNVPLNRRDPGPDGVVNTGDDGPMVTIADFDAAYRGSAFVVNERINQPEDNTAQTIEGMLTKRLSGRWSLTGAFAATKQHRWLVTAITDPNLEYYPIDDTWTHIFRLNGSYTLPYDITLGGTLAVKSGVLGQRSYVFRAADPLGGAPLRQQTTVTLRLEPFGASRGPEQRYLDLRLGKTLPLAGARLLLSFDLLNVLNANVPEAIDFTSGPTYGRVTLIPPPRIIRLGAQIDF